MADKIKLTLFASAIVFLSVIHNTPAGYSQDSDIPFAREPYIEYTDVVPIYLREMAPNRVFYEVGHPSFREFYDIFINNEKKSLLTRKYLTGDWGGLRTKLSETGIIPTMTYVVDIQGNPVGGDKKGFRYFHNIGLDIVFDVGKLAGWKGARFHISASQRSGSSLSIRDIKNIFNVAQVCCGATFKLVNFSFQQSLLEDKLNILLRRISGGDEFLSSPLCWLFVQNGIDGNPVGIFLNVGFSAYPNATWGVRVKAKPTKNYYIKSGLYNANPNRTKNSKHGADLSFDGPYLIIAETGYHLNELLNSTGLPGNYKLGAYYQTGDFDNFSDPDSTKNGNFGFYILLDQMIYREKVGTGVNANQGLHPFVSLLFAPDNEINTMPFFLNGGLVYKGLIPCRDNDHAGFAVVYGKFSNKLATSDSATLTTLDSTTLELNVSADNSKRQSSETVLEWMYKIQLTKWLNIQPDIQYIIKPGGTGEIPNALVLGFQLGVNI